jgi:hypothetical protein
MGGFAYVALERAAKIADDFIFADGTANVFEQLTKLDAFLTKEGCGASFL